MRAIAGTVHRQRNKPTALATSEESMIRKMVQPTFDPGLTQQYDGVLKRSVNKDGRFNVRRVGSTWRDAHPYLFLINTSWTQFLLLIAVGFAVINTLFACLYAAIGFSHIKGAEATTQVQHFINVFFFSAHTLTTVGYGNMWPEGIAANAIASLEALTGLMLFAIATGLLFGRFSRPSARFGFSPNMIIAPYQGITSLQFRVVNRRPNNLINLQARVLLMTVDVCDGKPSRKYDLLTLERAQVFFLPLTWTVVHPIDEKSPLSKLTEGDYARLQIEIVIILEAFDESFGQTIHARYSYRYDEIVWGAKFAQVFEVEPTGDLLLEVGRVGELEHVALGDALFTSKA